jgi:TPR repeat protein
MLVLAQVSSRKTSSAALISGWRARQASRAAAIAALLWAVRAPGAFADAAGAWQVYRTGKYELALKELKALAEAGDAQAQYYLGTLHSDGKAVKRDYRQAVEWYAAAANKGHADAEFTLGFLYLNDAGEGVGTVPADIPLAARWLKIAAAKGNAAAQSTLATLYGEGYGMAPDAAGALRWADPAALRGDAAAQYELGRLKTQTLTVESWGEAYTWFRLAESRAIPAPPNAG